MIVPFVSFSVDVLIRFVSVMYCVVQEVIKCQLIQKDGFYFFGPAELGAVPLLAAARQ